MSYLEAISLTKTLPCLAEPDKIIVIGEPSCPLGDVIPYLATLPGVIAYNPETRTLTFRRPRGFLTLYPEKVYITQVKDINEGLELLKTLTEAINVTWGHRHELVAVAIRRSSPRPLDVWTLLPQTNCKQCGEETCLAFACSLIMQKRRLAECAPLHADSTFLDRRANLEAMI